MKAIKLEQLITGQPLAVREKELAELAKTKAERTYPVRFQHKQQHLAWHRVRIELPKYRIANGRTRAAQQDYIATNSLPAKFFDLSKTEDDQVQKAQHAVLLEMIRNSNPDKDLLKFFKKNEQDEPLILDRKGFVVNGNRRLCALRELLAADPKAFQRYVHVDVVVLPACSPKDIDELEAQLQVQEDIREDYSWVSLAYILREKQNEYDEDTLAETYGMKPKDVKTLLLKLQQAEAYLKSRNQAGHYKLVERADYAFEVLGRQTAKIAKEPGKQAFFTEVVYNMIADPKGDRLYASIGDLPEVIDTVRTKLESEVIKALPKKPTPAEKKAPPALHDELFGVAETAKSKAEAAFVDAAKALRASQDDKAVSQKLLAIVQDALQQKREQELLSKRENYVLEQVRRANTTLQNVVSVLHKASNGAGVEPQLKEIEASIQSIRKGL
jgi:hypothetical protein